MREACVLGKGFVTGCDSEAELPHKYDNNHGLGAGGLTINVSGRLWGQEVEAYVAKMGGKSENAWDLYDSGASHHMSPQREDFINYVEIPEKLLTAANKEIFTAVGMGDMVVSIPNGDKEAKMKLSCVLYTLALGFTLISIGQIDEAGYFSTFGGGKCEIQMGKRRTVGIVPKSGGVYRVPHGSHVAAAAVSVKQMTLEELHHRLGHISPRIVKDLIRHGIIDGVVLTNTSEDFECQSCILAKTTRKSVPKVRQGEQAKEFAEEIHTDIWGPASIATFGGRRYYISFMDDWSRWVTVCLLRQKSEAFRAYKDFAAWVSTQLDRPIKCLHADRGSKYLSEAFVTFLDEKGTARKLTVHDTPEQNGVAERLNRTLIEKVHAMMISCQLPRGLWGEALMHAVWLKNRMWTRALLSGVTPYELVMGDSLVLRDIPEWGSITWVHDTSSGKLSVCTNEGRWVGYDLNSDGHRVYWKDRRTVTVEHNVVFSKGDLPCIEDLIVEGITDEPEGENNGEREVSLDRDEEGTAPIPANKPERAKTPAPENSSMPDVRRSARNKLPN
jgi:transposase InsO family protein